LWLAEQYSRLSVTQYARFSDFFSQPVKAMVNEHEQDMGRGKRRATRRCLKGCDLLWLLIIEQGKILLLQSRDRVAGCIGHKNIQDDVVLGPICAFPIISLSGINLTGRLGAGVADCPEVARGVSGALGS
jgi:hypothetical protein